MQTGKSRVGDGVNSCADIKCDQRGDLCLVAPSSSDRLTHTKSPIVVENYDLDFLETFYRKQENLDHPCHPGQPGHLGHPSHTGC